MSENPFIKAAETPENAYIRKLATAVQRRAPMDAADILAKESDDIIAKVLGRLHQTLALKVLLRFPDERRDSIVPEVTARMTWKLSYHRQQNE